MMQSRFLKLAGMVTVINILARLMGFAREVLVGYQYGTSYQADSIITAFTIPNFIYLVVGGAVTTAFISVYTKLAPLRKKEFSQTIFTWLSLAVGILTVLFIVFPAFWIELFFAGMPGDALELTTELFIWTAPDTFFLVMSITLSGLHNIHENYRLSSFSALLFNGIYLIIGAGLTPFLMAFSYALGATVGAVLMFFLLVHYIRKQQLVPLRLKLQKIPETKRFLKLALPLIFGGATIQFHLIIQRIFAADLGSGTIAALNYASKMTQFPQAVLMTSVTTIIYPILAKAAGEGDHIRLRNAYQRGFRLLTVTLLPASIFIFFFAQDMISFVFEYGNFSRDSTNTTYPLLQLFSLSILGLALNTYVTRFFYAMERTILPVILNAVSVFIVNVLIIVYFIDSMGAMAIALGMVVSTKMNMILLIVFAKVRLHLVASSWNYIGKLVLFVIVSAVLLWAASTIVFSFTLFALLLGSMVTTVVIAVGLKVVK